MLIVDLECTCWKEKDKPHEIIEIGAVCDGPYKNVKFYQEFQIFVKPILNPVLSPFCTELTHINQADIDKAVNFESA